MKKILLILSLFFCMILFTACKGSTITSTTKFHEDGSGIRTVSAFIKKSDAKKMKLSFEELDKMLEAVAPASVNLSRTMNAKNDATYEFSFSFSDIDDYNKKIEEITGESHDAIWYSDPSIFKSNITFTETNVTYDLVKWAFKALENSGYSKLYDNLDLYQIGANNVYMEDELVYQEEGQNDNPSFTINTSQMLNKISIYTKYDNEQNLSKQIILEFDKTNFAKLNTDLANELLDNYSKDFQIDLANATISLTLTGEEKVRSFLENADSNYIADNVKYKLNNPTPFTFSFEFLENYNLSKFFNNFMMNTEYINNYLSLPEDLKYQNRIFYSPNITEEENKDYAFAGKYKVYDDYTANFSIDSKVNINDIHVLYDFDDKYVNTIQTSFTLSKSDYPINLKEIKAYYKEKADFVSVDKKDSTYVVTLTNKYSLHSKFYKDDSISSLKTKSNNLIKKIEEYQSEYKLSDYIPIELDNKIQYEFVVSPELNLKDLSFNKKAVDMPPANNQNLDKDGKLHITLDSDSKTDGKILMKFVTKRPIFPFVIIAVIIIFMGVLIYITVKDLKKDEDSTVLDNWVARVKALWTSLKDYRNNKTEGN